MLRYPPAELTWEEVWKDAYVSALQINTTETKDMAECPPDTTHYLALLRTPPLSALSHPYPSFFPLLVSLSLQ